MKLKVANDFSRTPGPRHIHEGKFSGEQFRKDVLLPKLREAIEKKQPLTVDLDGTAGFGTSFLEESFGGLIRHDKFPLLTLDAALKFVSNEEPELLDEIKEYMRDAEQERTA
jgi:hypothetical protein